MSKFSVQCILASFLAFAPTVHADADECISYMNSLRAKAGHDALDQDSSKADCAASDASYDCENGPHSSFGKCDEGAQCEAQNEDDDGCHMSVDQFYSEGPGGGHYDTMMSDDYCSVSWGSYSNCQKMDNMNFFTFNFYGCGAKVKGNMTKRTVVAPTVHAAADTKRAVVAPKVRDADECISYMNSLRAKAGHDALDQDSSKADCAASDASYDCANGPHSSFGKCDEGAQCEAQNEDDDGCHMSVDQFYSEGPGGGHYDTMMSDDYCSVSWGSYSNCQQMDNMNFFTFNFYGCGAKARGNVTNRVVLI